MEAIDTDGEGREREDIGDEEEKFPGSAAKKGSGWIMVALSRETKSN